MPEGNSSLDLTVRALIDRAVNQWDFVVHDDEGKPCLVVLPFAHFLKLREKADQDKQGWWDMREAIAREIQFAMDLPENPSIRDLIEFGQR
jgi:hypothetical protein